MLFVDTDRPNQLDNTKTMSSFTKGSIKSDKEILLECSSGVALAVNTSRTGFITRQELSDFFESVNQAYKIPEAKKAGAKRADDILSQVGTDLTSVPAAKLKRICLKLKIDISNFLEKADYIRAVTELTGASRVVPLFSLSAWLHQTFNGHPDKLQRIQDIALDHLVQHTRSESNRDTKANASNHTTTRPTSNSEYSGTSWNGSGGSGGSGGGSGSGGSGSSGRSPTLSSNNSDSKRISSEYSSSNNASGEYSSSGNSRPYSTSPSAIPRNVYQSTETSSDSPRTTIRKKNKRHARRRTMVALDMFSKLDRHSLGSISRRDFLLACRKDKEVAVFLGLPQKISQEGDSREKLEDVFQGIGSEGDTVTIEQFVQHFKKLDCCVETVETNET